MIGEQTAFAHANSGLSTPGDQKFGHQMSALTGALLANSDQVDQLCKMVLLPATWAESTSAPIDLRCAQDVFESRPKILELIRRHIDSSLLVFLGLPDEFFDKRKEWLSHLPLQV
jgi:hypothetical protein